MTTRSTKSPSRIARADDDEGVSAGFFFRHRRVIGGATAFAVAFSYVAANAVWYQPHAHGGAFFATRPHNPLPEQDEDGARAETIIRLEPGPAQAARQPARQAQTPSGGAAPADPVAVQPARPKGDPVVEKVQRILSGLNLYEGDIDGLNGPRTRAAIEKYRRVVGLDASSEIDERLLVQLGAAPREAAAPPTPRQSPGTDMIQTSSAVPAQDPTIMRIQAGLKAFGNEAIEIDGVVGSRTRAALREFQALFGLPETGEPDAAVYAKMREIGLAN